MNWQTYLHRIDPNSIHYQRRRLGPEIRREVMDAEIYFGPYRVAPATRSGLISIRLLLGLCFSIQIFILFLSGMSSALFLKRDGKKSVESIANQESGR